MDKLCQIFCAHRLMWPWWVTGLRALGVKSAIYYSNCLVTIAPLCPLLCPCCPLVSQSWCCPWVSHKTDNKLLKEGVPHTLITYRHQLVLSSVITVNISDINAYLPPPKKEVMFLVWSVCLFVCLFVRLSVCLSVRRITRKLVNGF